MKISFPSREFDDVVAAVCHGSASEDQVRALAEVLRTDCAARDEYILRIELHSRLASEPDLFIPAGGSLRDAEAFAENVISPKKGSTTKRNRRLAWAFALAACLALLAGGFWRSGRARRSPQTATSKAVAMLNRTVDAQWNKAGPIPRLGAPLEPGPLRLESGLAQIVFYSGTRLIMEGPAELQLISQNQASCRQGKIKADVPEQARGFRMETPQTVVTDLGTSFGLEVKERQTELHVFKGAVKLQAGQSAREHNVDAGGGAVIESSTGLRKIEANPAAFASLFKLQERSIAADALRYDQWRIASEHINSDPSLLVHYDFGSLAPSGWQLRNCARKGAMIPDATIVGCQRGEGRWPEKRSLDFQSVNDRLRFTVPGEFESLTLSAWVSVKGLDRKINSLLMSDGFEPGTVHWVIRKDGVVGLTVIGPGKSDYQIIASPPVLPLDKFGMWLHLAVVLDGKDKRVVHYFNGAVVSEKALKIKPPFRIGAAELGNWNPKGFPQDDPFMIRNFSGALDEFCVFSRALDEGEIRRLYSTGKPQLDPVAARARDSGNKPLSR